MGKSFGAMSSLIYCINPLQPPNSGTGGLRSSGQKCGAVERLLDHESGDKVSRRGLPLTPWAGLGGGKPRLTCSLKAKTVLYTPLLPLLPLLLLFLQCLLGAGYWGRCLTYSGSLNLHVPENVSVSPFYR